MNFGTKGRNNDPKFQHITPNGRLHITATGIETDINNIRAGQRSKDKSLHPTKYYGPLLKAIKELIMEYEDLRTQFWAYQAVMCDVAIQMGYNIEHARTMIKRKNELPSGLKNWIKDNNLSEEEAIRYLQQDEFDFIKLFIQKRGLVIINDERLRENIARVKEDIIIENKNKNKNEER